MYHHDHVYFTCFACNDFILKEFVKINVFVFKYISIYPAYLTLYMYDILCPPSPPPMPLTEVPLLIHCKVFDWFFCFIPVYVTMSLSSFPLQEELQGRINPLKCLDPKHLEKVQKHQERHLGKPKRDFHLKPRTKVPPTPPTTYRIGKPDTVESSRKNCVNFFLVSTHWSCREICLLQF